MAETADKLQRVVENQRYYEAMDATISVESEPLDFDFQMDDPGIEVHVHPKRHMWKIQQGREMLHYTPSTGLRYKKTAKGEEYPVRRVEITLGVKADD